MKPISLVPAGNPDRNLLTDLVPALRHAFGVPAELRHSPIDPAPFYDESRGQFNSTRLLQSLKDRSPHYAGAVTLAVIPDDLFIPILTFVFGEAELNGTVAVVSYHRLENQRYGLPPDRGLLFRRLEKEALHELGHVYGLLHCIDLQCVMHTSSTVEEIDLKGGDFCADCRAALKRAP